MPDNHSYTVQGLEVQIFSDAYLSPFISNYFQPLYRGKKKMNLRPFQIRLRITDNPPRPQYDTVKAIKTPGGTCYRNNAITYFLSVDGSILCLDPVKQKADGFLKKGIIDSAGLSTLLTSCIMEILKYSGLYLLHAAAIQQNGLRCLVSGDGGAGKTTMTLSLVREGFKYVSDDAVFLRYLNDRASVSPLYKYIHVDQNLADRFPGLSGNKKLRIPEGTKKDVDISKIFPDSFIPLSTPNIIIFPKIVSDKKSSLHSVNKMEMYRRLLKQTILSVDNDISKKQLKALEHLVNQTQGFELLSGRDVHDNPQKLAAILKGINY